MSGRRGHALPLNPSWTKPNPNTNTNPNSGPNLGVKLFLGGRENGSHHSAPLMCHLHVGQKGFWDAGNQGERGARTL